MEPQPNNEEQTERPPAEYIKAKPPIFYVYEFLLARPMLLGALIGALLGLVIAANTGVSTTGGIVGGAVGGAIVTGFFLRLRLR